MSKNEISDEEIRRMLGSNSLLTKPSSVSEPSKQTDVTLTSEDAEATESNIPKRVSPKQRKASFAEYKDLYLRVPKITNRKTVFISEKLRDQIDEITRRLGDRKMSVSGFLENLVTHHLEIYKDDLEVWKKL